MPRWAVPVFVDPSVSVWDILTIFSVQSRVPVVFGPALTLEGRILTIFSVQSRVPVVFGPALTLEERILTIFSVQSRVLIVFETTLTLEGTLPQKVLKISTASDSSLVVSQALLTQLTMLFSASYR